MEIPFTKMHGLGNSYIYLDLFNKSYDESLFSPLAMAISNINTGVGSDGLILIQRSDVADVGMRIFNKDGSEGQSCGNGLRCVAKYVYENKICLNRVFQIETKAGIVTAEVFGQEKDVHLISVNMGQPLLYRNQVPMLGEGNLKVINEPFQVNNHLLYVTALFLGNPHAVFFVDCIELAPVNELGSLISEDSRFPVRVNVEFVEVVSETDLNFRVWERGSGITKACGSGACAAVVASVLNGFVKKDQDILVHLDGGDLTIKWANEGDVWMTGPAETTGKGVFYFG